MVGVGGRSKACDHCRRRRIKCDLGKPSCEKCVKAGLTCGGSRAITFVFHESGKFSHSDHRNEAASTVRVPNRTRHGRPAAVANSLHLTLSVPSDEIFKNFARARLFQGPDAEDIVSPEVDNSLTDSSFLALATIYFGAEHKNIGLTTCGLRRYSHAIEQINGALSDPARRLSLDLLGAIVTMSLLEFLMSERDRGWVHHARGFERLMEVRGPEAFMPLPALMLMERTRASIIFAALATRQTTIIASSAWKTIPWTWFPARKSFMQRLLDIFADCPAILAAQTRIARDTQMGQSNEESPDLLLTTEDLLTELDLFQDEWKLFHLDCIWEAPSSETTPLVPDEEGILVPFWTTVLHFSSLEHANIVALGSGVRIFLLLVYLDLTPRRSWEITESVSAQLIQAAATICRAIDYQLSETRKGASNHLLFWPLKMAYDALGHENPLLGVWLQSHLNNIANGLSGRWSLLGQPLSRLVQERRSNVVA